MTEMNDDELQQWLENGIGETNGIFAPEDAGAYRQLFELLDKEPEAGLPYDFSARVMNAVKADRKHRVDFKWSLLALAIFIITAFVVYELFSVYNPATLPLLKTYKWIAVVIPVAFIAIQWLDQRLVKGGIFKL
jgi:hypothetical protein